MCSSMYLVLNSNTLYLLCGCPISFRLLKSDVTSQYLFQTTLVEDHTMSLSRSDYFSVIKQKYFVYVGALSRSRANIY